MITQEQVDSIKALLLGKKNIVILTHLSPDGDAMGSALGLCNWLGNAKVIVPNRFPDFCHGFPERATLLSISTKNKHPKRQ